MLISTKILAMAEEDRPREKLLHKGKVNLTDAELIAILLGSGTAQQSAVDLARDLLREVEGDLSALAKMQPKDLMRFKGIGEAKAITIVSAMELGRRRGQTKSERKPRISSSSDVYTLMKPVLLDELIEHFYIVLLNRANLVLRTVKISSGGTNATIADPKLIFKYALDYLASSMILVHNHPSGNLKPSEPDRRLTKRLLEVGKSLEIPVLDHVIFTDAGYYSFADEGIL
ncbi:RadC family protein [Nitritalea halalkaliphila]|nr:DNA repair protein RadC [Nitritalea halalkaliphila]